MEDDVRGAFEALQGTIGLQVEHNAQTNEAIGEIRTTLDGQVTTNRQVNDRLNALDRVSFVSPIAVAVLFIIGFVVSALLIRYAAGYMRDIAAEGTNKQVKVSWDNFSWLIWVVGGIIGGIALTGLAGFRLVNRAESTDQHDQQDQPAPSQPRQRRRLARRRTLGFGRGEEDDTTQEMPTPVTTTPPEPVVVEADDSWTAQPAATGDPTPRVPATTANS